VCEKTTNSCFFPLFFQLLLTFFSSASCFLGQTNKHTNSFYESSEKNIVIFGLAFFLDRTKKN